MARSSPKRRAPCTAPWSGEVPRACKVTREGEECGPPNVTYTPFNNHDTPLAAPPYARTLSPYNARVELSLIPCHKHITPAIRGFV